MAYEYNIILNDVSDKFDFQSLEKKVLAIPYTLKSDIKGQEFLVITGNKKNMEFVRGLMHSDSTAAADLSGTITIKSDQISISNPEYTDEITLSLRSFCEWVISEYRCHLEDEFGVRVKINEAFGNTN